MWEMRHFFVPMGPVSRKSYLQPGGRVGGRSHIRKKALFSEMLSTCGNVCTLRFCAHIEGKEEKSLHECRHKTYRVRLKFGAHVSEIMLLLLLTTSAWLCLHLSRNLRPTLWSSPVRKSRQFFPPRLYENGHSTLAIPWNGFCLLHITAKSSHVHVVEFH